MSEGSSEDDTPQGFVERFMPRIRALAQQTGNPVYAWVALDLLRFTRLLAKENGEPLPAVVLPHWCTDYFLGVAQDTSSLACGNDIRDAKTLGRLSPDNAMELLPVAFGFTSPGKNAFKKFQASEDARTLFNLYQERRSSGIPSGAAMTAVIDFLAEREENLESSVVRQRITKGRVLVKGLMPDEPDVD